MAEHLRSPGGPGQRALGFPARSRRFAVEAVAPAAVEESMLWPFGYTAYSLGFDGSEVTPDELEFLLAMAAYQRRARRRFPTWREVLHVARCLGYRKVADPVPADEPTPPQTEAHG